MLPMVESVGKSAVHMDVLISLSYSHEVILMEENYEQLEREREKGAIIPREDTHTKYRRRQNYRSI